MPYQIWTQDQRPQLIMDGARGLARGLEMGIAGIGTGVRSILDNRNEAAMLRAAMEQDDDKQLVGNEITPVQGLPGGTPQGPDQGSGEGGAGMNAETFKREATQTRALRDYNHTAFGLSKDKLSTMGLSELRGTMRNMEMKQAHQDGLERSLFRRAQIASLADSLQTAQEQRANTARFPDAVRSLIAATAPSVGQMQDFYEGAPGVMPDEAQRPQSRPITPRDFFQSLDASGFNPGTETDNLLRGIEAGNARGTGVDWENVKPREGKTSSGRGYVYGKGGQFQFEPDMTNGGQDPERTLSDGTTIFWNGRQWVTAPRAKADPGQVTDRDRFKAIQQQIAAIGPFAGSDPKMAARLKELESELGGLGQGGSGAAAPGREPMVMPKSKAELQKGQYYNTARGRALWDGEKFTQ